MTEPQRYLLGLAYQAGPDPAIQRGADGGRDYFSEAELEKAAWRFMSDGPRDIGINHVDGTIGHATAVESYVYRGPDWVVGDAVIKSGDWLLGAVLDETAWQMHLDGLITGFSPQGTATRRTTRKAE
jgi:hypothetical protein